VMVIIFAIIVKKNQQNLRIVK